ncbi:unnamed protein product [Acanthoscelides obtectus]|uniref:Uncharacterized protein n=1 Tax=Acanthoscelides obtectus TaxID=200917 RepID=A0A9P0NVM8_ACAOB|nr:unnamed protein product [Acanthoscelides obtectus]CAK1640279.1 hypothetical protein AOBTE_LOCUS11636 [Acanthoscelides obtectus]
MSFFHSKSFFSTKFDIELTAVKDWEYRISS